MICTLSFWAKLGLTVHYTFVYLCFLYSDVYMKKIALNSRKMEEKNIFVFAFVWMFFNQLSDRDCFPFLAYHHWCLAANLRIGIYNGEMVFNILFGNCWSDLDDFFGRPPWNFDSDEKLKKSALWHACASAFVLCAKRILFFFAQMCFCFLRHFFLWGIK